LVQSENGQQSIDAEEYPAPKRTGEFLWARGYQMTVSTVLSWMLCGLVIGLLARALVPGRQSMSLFLTMVLGIVGAVVGGLLYSLVKETHDAPFSLYGNAWHGWIISLLGALLVVAAYGSLAPRSWRE
jgi:uncharacterized membrane protein YeaQ/YmgE (transglycosylase-associated protein family)